MDEFRQPCLLIANNFNSQESKNPDLKFDKDALNKLLNTANEKIEPNYENRLNNLQKISLRLFYFLQEQINANNQLDNGKKQELIEELKKHRILQEYADTQSS